MRRGRSRRRARGPLRGLSARAALGFLFLISAAALLAPALPLAAPGRTHSWQAFHPPQAAGERGFWLHEPPQASAADKLLPWERPLAAARRAIWGDRVLPPLLGRDALGRCLLARVIWGARVSLLVGLAAGLISLVVGVLYGAIAGFLGGWADNVMMRIVDACYSIPFIFLVIFLVALLRRDVRDPAGGGSSSLAVFLLAIGLVYWLTMARVVRGQVISLREQEFVEGARAQGAGRFRILLRHILPHVAPVIVVYLTLTIPRILLFEAFLSFLGLGVEAPRVSWGVLAREAFEILNPIRTAWWLVLWPSLFLAATLAALNHLGDRLRDALDPRGAGRRW